MPIRLFSRSSPKKSANSNGDGMESTAKDPARPPLFPLQELPWNSFVADGKNDLLTTPRSAMKWLSSTPLPDPPFFESQENFSSLSPERLPNSAHNLKVKVTTKESKLRFPNGFEAEGTTLSARSSASSGSLQDQYFGNSNLDQKSLYATPQASSNDPESGLVAGITPVARSLKYSQLAVSGSGSSMPMESCTSTVSAALPLVHAVGSTQPHFEVEEDPNFWKDHNVQVVIRLRPLSSFELATQGQSRCIRQDSPHALTWTGHPESRFTFDLVACETIMQENIFKVAGMPMVDNCMAGYNSCMFAYGQTGSGKTHTMLGDLEGADHRPSSDRGMTPRVFEYLFARIDQEEETRANERLKYVCKCSFLEIYNEQILDLLEPASSNLQLREDAKKGVYVESLSEVEVKNVHEVIRLLLQGAVNRKVAATNMNRESSRSHSVFTCIIESKWVNQSVTNSRCSRLNLVDLAGSERQKSSGAEGERLKEAANINKSLSTLGLVIMSLVDIANGKQRHVPYRDSKLTFLLHDSLGGNSKTTIIANISPSNCCAMETLSTLKFAQRAKFIRNNAIVNENSLGDVMALRLQVQQLKRELSLLRFQGIGGNMVHGGELLPEGVIGGGDMNPLDLSMINNSGHSAYSLEAWDSLKALASPTFSSKKRKELEFALLGSLRREQAAETRIRQLHAEIEQFKRLVKQREEDSQCGKMMLRFREDRIKRLESALGGVISADTYLMEEKTSLLEEVNILRTRLERNPEVTRFAMENIRLLEELRRFQDFYEAGERDMMGEEISALRDQLLEALDWKLMHEQDPLALEKAPEPKSGTINEETESLQLEVDRSKLEKQIETVETVASMQAELLAMREAVAAATKGELEARGRVSLLTREIQELQNGLKELQEENVRLCSMYQSALCEKDALIQDFRRDWESTTERKDGEISELRCSLHQAREALRIMEMEQQQWKRLGAAQTLGKDWEEEAVDLRNKLKSTVVEREEVIKELNRDWQLANKKIENEKEELRKALEDAHKAITQMQQETKSLDKHQGMDVKSENEAEATNCTAIPESLMELQKENSRLYSLYQSVLAENERLVEQLRTDNPLEEIERDEKKMQYQEYDVQKSIELLQKSLKELEDKDHANKTQMEALQISLKELQDENEKLKALYQTALTEKDALITELSRVCLHMTAKDTELLELRSALQSSKNLLEDVALQCRETEPCAKDNIENENHDRAYQELSLMLISLNEYSSKLQKVDERVMGMMDALGKKVENVDLFLDKVQASARKLEGGNEIFESTIDRLSVEMPALFSVCDASENEIQALRAEVEDARSRLKEAEQARDDVCLLSSVEKNAWVQEKSVLQERLDEALELLSARERALSSGLSCAQSKIGLLQGKLAELSVLVDTELMCLTNPKNTQEDKHASGVDLPAIEKEERMVEDSLGMVQMKLRQAENKVHALKTVLNGLSSAKQAWFSREEKMRGHLQKLSSVLVEKELEITGLQREKEKSVVSLDELLKFKELTMLEGAKLKEQLQASDRILGPSSFSMLQLLRGQEEKATLLSVIDDLHEKVEVVRTDIEGLRGQIDKTDTALMFAQVDFEAAFTSLQEAEAELEELKKEKQVLIEAEAEGKSELELLTAELENVQAEEGELAVHLQECKKNLQEQKDRLKQPEQRREDTEEGNQRLKEKLTNLSALFAETRNVVLGLKAVVEGLVCT